MTALKPALLPGNVGFLFTDLFVLHSYSIVNGLSKNRVIGYYVAEEKGEIEEPLIIEGMTNRACDITLGLKRNISLKQHTKTPCPVDTGFAFTY